MTKPKSPAPERFNRVRASRILVDAITLGDRTAADRHQVAEKTIQRYRARLLNDPELSKIVQEKGREAEHGWHFARARFLRKTLTKLEQLVDAATAANFDQVINALKAAGELDLATEALGVGRGNRQQDSATAGAEGESEDPQGSGAG